MRMKMSMVVEGIDGVAVMVVVVDDRKETVVVNQKEGCQGYLRGMIAMVVWVYC